MQFLLTAEWQVVAGEESKEVDVQNQREMRVLEAVYPRPSAIPQKSETYLFIFLFFWLYLPVMLLFHELTFCPLLVQSCGFIRLA